MFQLYALDMLLKTTAPNDVILVYIIKNCQLAEI